MNPCSPNWLQVKLRLYSASVGGRLGRIAFGLQMWPSTQAASVAFESGMRKSLRVANPHHGAC